MGKLRDQYDNLYHNKEFVGEKHNIENENRYQNLIKLAENLQGCKSPTFSCNIKVEGSDQSRRNAMIYIDIDNPVTLLTESQRNAMASLILNSDACIVAHIKEKIRFSFGVTNIWE